MSIVIRQATQQDYEAVCTLFAQGDHLHAQALPEIFQPYEGSARSQEFLTRLLSNKNEGLFVAEQQGVLIGMIHCSVRFSPALPLFVPRRFVFVENLVEEHSNFRWLEPRVALRYPLVSGLRGCILDQLPQYLTSGQVYHID